MSKNYRLTLFSFVAVPFFFSGVLAAFSPCKQQPPAPLTLEFWSVFDDSDAYAPLIAAFEKQYPNVTVNYHKKNIAAYEQELLDAMAAGRGPDIFSINNAWLARYANKLTPAPKEIFSLQNFRDAFVDVAEQDFVLNGEIFALPFSVDTLALYYNKDLLNSAGVALPPATWDDFNAAVETLTKKDSQGEILQAGAALGTSQNVNRCTDILALLMIQSGAQMVSPDKTRAAFDQAIVSGQEVFSPASRALTFYVNFADPAKKVYTWNARQHYSLDAFAQNETAMMLNYDYQIPVLRAKAPHLNFDVAPLPQISKTGTAVSYANYWGQGVAKSSPNVSAAWQFISWLAQPENLRQYLQITKKPASRRDLIDSQKNDPDLAVFARQTLSARSWWQADNSAIEKIFARMIDNALASPSFVDQIVKDGASQVTGLMGRTGQ